MNEDPDVHKDGRGCRGASTEMGAPGIMSRCIGFIGFGEVAAVFSRRLRERGVEVFAFDRLLDEPRNRGTLRRRSSELGVHLTPLGELPARAKILLSTVTSQAAVEAAAACVPHLSSEHLYVDLNSTSPSVKLQVAKLIQGSGAVFVEGAILDAIGVSGASARILLVGEQSAVVEEALRGLNVDLMSGQIGRASRFKMLRSIFSKGLEALLIELLLSARGAGMEQELWQEVVTLLTDKPFELVASNWVQTHPAACERRYHELEQVVETVRETGVEPIMAQATLSLFRRSLSLGLKRAFAEKAGTVTEVIEAIAEGSTRPDTGRAQ